jgi:hypothetical protein
MSEAEQPVDLEPLLTAVDRGRMLDQRVRELQLLLVDEEGSRDIASILMMLSADVGNAQAAFLNDDRKPAMAFLMRVSAAIRYLLADRPEFGDLAEMLRGAR